VAKGQILAIITIMLIKHLETLQNNITHQKHITSKKHEHALREPFKIHKIDLYLHILKHQDNFYFIAHCRIQNNPGEAKKTDKTTG
jgi:hypothetical protein